MLNKVMLIGNLGADPEIRYTTSGTAVATLRLATNRKWKDKEGNLVDETEWHRIIVWAKSAEYCGNYLSKGAKIYVEGRLQTRKWQDQTGNDKYTTEIIANNVQNLTPRPNESGGGGFNEPPLPPEPFDSMSGGVTNGGGTNGGGTGDGGTGEEVPF